MKFIFLFLMMSTVCLCITGCMEYKVENISDIGKGEMMKAKVVVQEQERVHNFDLYYDTDRSVTVLDGSFTIEGKKWPAKMYFEEDRSVLFRENPDQCIIFPKNYVIYGFLPPSIVDSRDYDTLAFNITVQKEESGIPTEYTVFVYDKLAESKVTISNIRGTAYKKQIFQVPDCQKFDYENMISI